MNPHGSLDPNTKAALELYVTTERPPGDRRILLRVVDDGHGGVCLKANDEREMGFFQRIALLFRSDYKLQRLAEFFESKNFTVPRDLKDQEIVKSALEKLDGKIKSHDAKIFSRTVKLQSGTLKHLFQIKLRDENLQQKLQENREKLNLPYSDAESFKDALQDSLRSVRQEVEILEDKAFSKAYKELEALFDQKLEELSTAATLPPRNVQIENINPIPADGNCLLRSFAAGLYFADLSGSLANPHEASNQLRHIAADYLQNNYQKDDQLKMLLKVAISEHNVAEEKKYQNEVSNLQAILDMNDLDRPVTQENFDTLQQTYEAVKVREEPPDYEKYIALSRLDQFFCASPHLYALSRHFQVSIEVYQVINKTPVLKALELMPAIPAFVGAKAKVLLHYEPKGPHYNVIRPKGVTQKLPEAPPVTETAKQIELETSTHIARLSPEEIKKKFGAGLINRGNACYVNSVVQGLRFVEAFREHLVKPNQKNIFSATVSKAYNVLEGTNSQQPQELELDSFDFRKTAMEMGWNAERLTSQEDAALFCQFLLHNLHVVPFDFKTNMTYDFPFRIPSLERQGGHDLYLALNLGENAEQTTIQGLVTDSHCIEEFHKKSTVEADDLALTDAGFKALEGMPENMSVDTYQTITFTKAGAPKLLPLSLKRYTFIDEETTIKDRRAILPSQTLEIPFSDDPTQYAKYRLRAVVVHPGDSPKYGHYYTYVPKVIDGEQVWLEYNDEAIRVHEVNVLDDIVHNGYLYFYERV